MKKSLIITMLALTAFSAYAAFLEVHVKIGVDTCTGSNSTCNVTINAVEEQPLNINVKDYKIEDLQENLKNNNGNLVMPVEQGDLKIYSVTPTEGDLANQLIYVAFDNVKQHGRLAGKNVVNVYRQLSGEPANHWPRVGRIRSNEPFTKVPVKFDPSGVLVIVDQYNNKEVRMDLAAKELTKKK